MRKTEPLSEDAQKEFGNSLETVFSALAKRFEEESSQTEPWKNLFKASDQGLKGILSEADMQMMRVVLNTTDVIKKKFGIRMSNKLYNLIKALPFVMNRLKDTIREQQGLSCCADKAREVFYQEVMAEIKYLISEQDNKEVE